ncbi:hypothetical protein [Reichenbachiella versicolor]|uniref:hypothetical protein n=1 Tax=Reichenbachiella versicolor TaxID=1821036 RepID=UPI000D6EA0DC|nr:hypothetical protein [Reichenbachiella versicolor]
MDRETVSCSQLISAHFQLDESELAEAVFLTDLTYLLTRIIRHLLDKDLNRLLNAFYKIDIGEDKFKSILTTAPPEELATILAQEVIQRELQKVKTREKYRSL